MKTFIFALLLALAFSVEIAEENDVLVLTDANFQHAIDNNDFILVEFYAPWCGHCKKLAPEFEKAAKVLKASEPAVPLAKVDATVEKECSGKFEIKGFPTLKFFNKGNAVDYNGGRVEKDIISWVQKRTGDVSKLIKDVPELDAFLEANKLAIIYFTEQTSGENWEVYNSVAMNYDKIAFAHTTVAAVAESKQSALGKLVLFKDFDEKRNDYEGQFTATEVKAWVDAKKVATVMEFDDTAIEIVFQKQTPTIFIFHNDTEESKTARAAFDAVAQQQKEGPVKFCYVIPTNQHWQRLADYIGVNTAVVPAVMLVKAGGEIQKFKFEGSAYTEEAIKSFLSDYQANKLSQHIKSEDLPATNDQPVKVIVGKNFEELVLNNNRDVLVKFYAPWCGHCKKLIPAWDEAAEKLSKVNPNIVIAKCDSTANEIPSVQVKGYPTLKFWAGNNKKAPVDFNGDRTTEGIISWLKDNTTHPWVELEGAAQAEPTEVKKDDL